MRFKPKQVVVYTQTSGIVRIGEVADINVHKTNGGVYINTVHRYNDPDKVWAFFDGKNSGATHVSLSKRNVTLYRPFNSPLYRVLTKES